jgi:hypothetical protein
MPATSLQRVASFREHEARGAVPEVARSRPSDLDRLDLGVPGQGQLAEPDLQPINIGFEALVFRPVPHLVRAVPTAYAT